MNIPEYTWVKTEFWICQNSEKPLMQYIASVHCTNYWAVIKTDVFRHCQTFKMEHFAKRIMPEWRHASRNCSGQGGSVKLRHFDKHFIKTQEKKVLQGNILGFFLVCTVKTTFWTDNLTQEWTQPGPFFEKSGDFNWFSKKGKGGLPHSSPSFVPVSVT